MYYLPFFALQYMIILLTTFSNFLDSWLILVFIDEKTTQLKIVKYYEKWKYSWKYKCKLCSFFSELCDLLHYERFWLTLFSHIHIFIWDYIYRVINGFLSLLSKYFIDCVLIWWVYQSIHCSKAKKKNICVFTVTRPTLFFSRRP